MKPMHRMTRLWRFLTEAEPDPVSIAASTLGKRGYEARVRGERLKVEATTAKLKAELGRA